MEPLRVRLARAIREIRREKGISQEGLADLAEIHRTTMSEIERGITNVSVDIIERISIGLGVSLATLFSVADAHPTAPGFEES
jgi:transcriptional regulator with XRE-family HTH domain